jgi:ATP-dependent Clp protease ATP-binding subunit ClpA
VAECAPELRRLQPPEPAAGDLWSRLKRRVVGQDEALRSIVPYVEMHHAGLAPSGRPVGVFLLLGPTGTGKTRTVSALAGALHGSERKMLRVDCGEFQLEHETAKLIGAPPGYLGHRETQPMISQQKLTSAASERSSLSLVLFDEIEKAAPSLRRLLLGVLDRAVLKLGDNTSVNFERSLIFLTSNLGAREMTKQLSGGVGFRGEGAIGEQGLRGISAGAVRRRFSPEFINRIDAMITYLPLKRAAMDVILDQQVAEIQQLVRERLHSAVFEVQLSSEAREFLMRRGASPEYGARELKRTVHRHLLQPLAELIARKRVSSGERLLVEAPADAERLVFYAKIGGLPPPEAPQAEDLVEGDEEIEDSQAAYRSAHMAAE